MTIREVSERYLLRKVLKNIGDRLKAIEIG